MTTGQWILCVYAGGVAVGTFMCWTVDHFLADDRPGPKPWEGLRWHQYLFGFLWPVTIPFLIAGLISLWELHKKDRDR